MTINTQWCKKHRESTKPESRQTAKMFFFFFFFRWASSNLRDSRWFLHKTAAFSTEQCTSSSLFLGLKSHKVIRITHLRTMASLLRYVKAASHCLNIPGKASLLECDGTFLVYIPKVLPLLLKLKMFVSMETPHPHVNNGTNYSYFQSYFVQGTRE